MIRCVSEDMGFFPQSLTAGLTVHDRRVSIQKVSMHIPDSEWAVIVNLAEHRERKFVSNDRTYGEGALSRHSGGES